MPTPVDQRLASRLHQQQVARLERSELAAVRAGRPYRKLAADLASIAAEGLPAAEVVRRAERLFQQAADKAHGDLEAALVDQVRRSHREAVDALLDTVPLRWFRVAEPALAALSVGEAEGPFQLDVEYEYEPVGSLSPEAAKKKLRELLFPPPDAETVERFLAGGHGGISWDERLDHWDQAARDQIRSQLVQGISAGEGYGELRRRLLPITDGVVYKAERIARTESRRVAERAQTAAFDSLGDMLDGMQVIATMDHWTRPEHAARNGKIFYRQPNGRYVARDGQVMPELPDAPNCRCFPSPVLRPPEEFARDPALRADLRNASGDTIPDPSAYGTWFERADDQQRKLAVGAKRYRTAAARLAPTGHRPEWSDFIDEDGRLLSPKRIESETADERADRQRRVEAMLAQRELLHKEAVAKGFVPPVRFMPNRDRRAAAGNLDRARPQPEPSTPRKPAGSPLEAALADGERRIRGRRVEVAIVYSPDGREVFSKVGTKTQVSFTQAELLKMPGNVLTHNHPWQTARGAAIRNIPLSGADAGMMIAHRMVAIRAVTEDFQFSLRLAAKPKGRSEADRLAAEVPRAWLRELTAIQDAEVRRLFAEVNGGRMTADEANRLLVESQGEHQHRTWLNVAPRYGLLYERLPNDE